MSMKSKYYSNKHSVENRSLLQSIAEYLLWLPRNAKRTILLLADFIMSVDGLYFAIAARYS